MSKKNIAILGSTGSIGRSTLDIVRSSPDKYNVVGLAAGGNSSLLAEQVFEFSPEIVSIGSAEKSGAISQLLNGKSVDIECGEEGAIAVATHPNADIIVAAMVGFAGLKPTLAALKASKTIALANKETLVAGGTLVKPYIKQGLIIPVDSEHAALAQCLLGSDGSEINRLILTASGGAFRDYPKDAIYNATPHQALQHPNWSMGAKITIDSATLMNKGLEVIEAHWLFDMPYDKIDVVVHPQSVVHSLVEFGDGSLIAQLGPPDMRLPIQFALEYPARTKAQYDAHPFSLLQVGRLDFREPDNMNFPCLNIAIEAGKAGGTMPAVLNAANEEAVALFLDEKIPFGAIAKIVEDTLAKTTNNEPNESNIFDADESARLTSREIAIKYYK